MSEKSRIFKDHKHYFSVWEECAWNCKYNPETKQIETLEPLAWGKTHIIIQKCKTSGDVGLQIIRFESNADQEVIDLKSNPYAGVYLKQTEWEVVRKRLENPIW